MRYSRAQLYGADLVLLLTLTARGKVFRFATTPINVANSDPEMGPSMLAYRGGLADDTAFQDAAKIGDVLQGRSTGISIDFCDDDGTAWGAFAAEDADLGDSVAELAMIRSGDDFIDREILISGRVISPTYGDRYEPLVFTIDDPIIDAQDMIPDKSQTVNALSWTSGSRGADVVVRDPRTDGAVYPVIFGHPGYKTDSNMIDFSGWPALQVEVDQIHRANNTGGVARAAAGLLLAGHACTASSVRIYNFSQKEKGAPSLAAYKYTDIFPCQTHTDDQGRAVTYCLVAGTGAPALICNEGDALYASFDQGGGGVIDPATGAEMRGAGQIMHWLLQYTGQIPLSDPAGVAASALDSYLLDLYINTPTKAITVITSEIAPLLPVSILQGVQGVKILAWNLEASQADIIDTIHPARRGGQRAGGVSFTSSSDIVNKMTINYCLDAETGKYKRALTYTAEDAAYASPDAPGGNDPAIIGNAYAGASQRRYGVRSGGSINASPIQDEATARAVLDWQIKYRGQTRRRARYQLPQHYQHLRPGDVIAWTDEDIGVANVLCFVLSVMRTPGDTIIEIETVPDWTGRV